MPPGIQLSDIAQLEGEYDYLIISRGMQLMLQLSNHPGLKWIEGKNFFHSTKGCSR